MNKARKAMRKGYLEELKRIGGQVRFNPDSGITVATMPCVKGEKAKFGRVAIAMCSENDNPRRKLGELLAVESLFDGCCLPIKIQSWDNPPSGLSWQDWVFDTFSREKFL